MLERLGKCAKGVHTLAIGCIGQGDLFACWWGWAGALEGTDRLEPAAGEHVQLPNCLPCGDRMPIGQDSSCEEVASMADLPKLVAGLGQCTQIFGLVRLQSGRLLVSLERPLPLLVAERLRADRRMQIGPFGHPLNRLADQLLRLSSIALLIQCQPKPKQIRGLIWVKSNCLAIGPDRLIILTNFA